MPMAKLKTTEAATLRAICDWLDKTNQVWLRHSPSNVVGKKGEATFRRIRDSQKGAPDVIWWRFWDNSQYHSRNHLESIAIEVKSPTGKQSPDQKRWQNKFEAVGGTYWLIRSVDAFLEKVK